MEFESLIIKDGAEATEITINRPEKRNALSLAVMEELTAAVRGAGGRVIVISGADPCFPPATTCRR